MIWTREQLFFDGDAWFKSILAQIEKAKFKIEIETYILEDDVLGWRVIRALEEAANRGIDVRLLVDGVGSWNILSKKFDALIGLKLQLRVWHPLPHLALRFSNKMARKNHPWYSLLASALKHINNRNHRKTCIIDGRYCYIGSFNVSAQHLHEIFGEKAWRDTGVFLEGLGVSRFQSAFERLWRKASAPKKKREPMQARLPMLKNNLRGSIAKLFNRSRFHSQISDFSRQTYPLVRLNTTRQDRKAVRMELMLRIADAREKVWISTAYFIPNSDLLHALKEAASQGADVRLLVPGKSDIAFMPVAAVAFYWTLWRCGVKIYEYKKSILHAKTLIIDRWTTVGSTNLNYRSFHHDLESDAVLVHDSSRLKLEQTFLTDLKDAQEVSIANLDKQSCWIMVMARLILIFRSFL